ncbi:PAS domain-containing protein [Methanoculleus sp. YWC-01]|uniref:histidine kinase n=1 Tax=Methanoculleus nereidis TaxID=2735141 RepID=A0ABU3Z4L4_9EURY|nr:ATP-binding protein [Methanoculleus sp. YWC-01]MCK9298863.1 PAS domain-containing protein [Methanoculleus sp.]MDV4343761.1 PAS domain-containing protein [Methanoculleus sp. YWC-01]
MPAPPEASRTGPDPAERDEDPQENPSRTERLVEKRLRGLQAEIDALRQENEELRLAETKRRRGEEALRKETERVGAILSALDTGQSLVEPDMTIVWVNQKAREYFPEYEPIGEKCYRLFEGMSEQCEVCAVRTVFSTGEVTRIEKYVPYRGRWFGIVAQPVKDASGRVTHALESFTDITEQKQAEAKLHAVMEREHLRATELDATLASIASGVIIYDTTGAIVRVNEVVREMIDRTPTSFDPIRFEERQAGFGVLREDGTPLSLEATPYYRALHGETVQGEEVMVTRLDREPLWVDTSAAPIRDGSGAIVGAIAILTDITGRKRAEEALIRHTEELTRLHCELEVANREANLYLDILTHDIGNTENVSRLYTDLLLDTLDGEAAGYLGNLKRSINKSIEILGTVSTIRRIHQASLELKRTDLDRAIQGAIENFPTSAVHYNGTCHQVRANDLLSVVFNNLISNAIKHGGPDVEVAVRVEELNGEVQISVEDTGPGVPDEEKEAIFHRYEQHKRGVGEGLGLYLVQILVERYGGRVWAEDRVPGRPGEGAAFRFTLKKA